MILLHQIFLTCSKNTMSCNSINHVSTCKHILKKDSTFLFGSVGTSNHANYRYINIYIDPKL